MTTLRYCGILAAIIGLPLAGALMAGVELQSFLHFPPPLAIPTGYVRFSWPAAGAVIALLAVIVAPWISRLCEPNSAGKEAASAGSRFPLWGWLAILWTLGWWHLAWTRWPWFASLQHYTFFPLWMGFIVSVNALTEARVGTCLLRREPARWLGLFAASALCWWTFEWLNRFVRNWHYLNVEQFGPVAYWVHGTLCFSTVLPAVSAIAEGLSASPAWRSPLANGPRWSWLARRGAAFALFAGGIVALLGTGAMPIWFYPALWVAPLALLLSEPVIARRSSIVDELRRGDWQRAATWMIAALLCGFFWELWNWRSLAKWIYTVPGVERWFVFEMPLLGYAGYLPFGLECLLVSERVIGDRWMSPRATKKG